jgi:hypothetical protein
MVRVTRRGGRLVAVETDFGSLSFDTVETDVERGLVRLRAEQLLPNGYAGRQLYRWFQQAGLADVSAEVIPVSVHDSGLARYFAGLEKAEQEAIAARLLSEDEVRRFRADLEQADRTESFFGSVSLVLVSGRKP